MAAKPTPDINLIRGDSSSIAFELTTDGVPTSLVGSTVSFTVKPTLADEATDATAVIQVDVTSHTDPTNGKTVIPLSSTDTDIEPGTYYYDIQVNNGSTIVSIPARRLTVSADVTRRAS